MNSKLTFRFFGQCFIEKPTAQESQKISPFLPLVRAFEDSLKTRVEPTWDQAAAFGRLVVQDTAAWRKLGADRLPHLVQPSGSIRSPLSLHLLNPTFYVADALTTITDDPTNPTIQMISDCGLSSEHCFMFDEICRRDRTDDCLFFYTKDVRQPHEDFEKGIRDNMSAVVEICFGEEVFKALSESVKLIRLPLWGIFKSVRLWLEVNEANPTSMKRFIMQAYHPQYFVRPGHLKKSGPSFSEIYAKPQDLMILMATQLAGLQNQIKVKPNFFECHLIRGKYNRLSPLQNLTRREHERQALDVFRLAFPERFEEFDIKQAQRKEENIFFREIQQAHGSLIPMETNLSSPIFEQEQISRIEAREEVLKSVILSFPEMAEYEDLFQKSSREEEIDYHPEVELLDFSNIPAPLKSWLQSQNGLKIHGLPILNRESLELAFALLDRGLSKSPLKNFSAIYIAYKVGLMYIKKISRPRSEFSLAQTIPAEPGKIIRLKCSGCQRPVLDDAFPWFTTNARQTYVIEVVRISQKGGNGCGQEGCRGKPGLVPLSRTVQDHTRLEERAIKQTTRRRSNWKAPLCRTGQDLDGCAGLIRVRCRGSGTGDNKIECGLERDYTTPEWSLHSPPRLILPRLKCDCDKRTKDHYFDPVDRDIPTISSDNLRKIYQGFLKVGCDLADYLKLPRIILDLKGNGEPRKHSRPYRYRFEELKKAKRIC
ncbi:uncharacterized protein N7506_003644 [Penicillium brevicompactum]|uniref:uncharacterized protein n=1 Tax=Penicillium brevicompactum TaxID=5074 RepID=UPI002540ED76|nr:uncharacterized protein N7506_003644 [Penicillium brevicompactum]KAJ5343820.1 hypothetical protein N7506_003644 [Penicillium brevicompactum]